MAANFGKIQAWGWDPGDDEWGSDVNNNFNTVDRLVANPAKAIVNDPSTISSPANNDVYIVGASPVGDFNGQAGRLSYWSSVAYGGDDSWKFWTAAEGQSISMTDGSVRTYSSVAGVNYWLQSNTINVATWAEFKNAMQSSAFSTVHVQEEVFAPVDDLITVFGHKRVTGLPVSIENTTLTLNSGTVDFFCEVHIGSQAGAPGELTGDSPLVRIRRVYAHTQSDYLGTGLVEYEYLTGVFTNTLQLFWDNTNQTKGPGSSAGVTSEVFLTADIDPINPPWLSLGSTAGVVVEEIQTLNVTSGNKTSFTKKFISGEFITPGVIQAGFYEMQLMCRTDSANETYLWQAQFEQMESDGTTVKNTLAELTSGVISMARNSTLPILLSNTLANSLDQDIGDRIRLTVSVTKVSGGGSTALSLYTGAAYRSFFNIPVQQTTDTVLDLSPVTNNGTLTEALTTLWTDKLDKAQTEAQSLESEVDFNGVTNLNNITNAQAPINANAPIRHKAIDSYYDSNGTLQGFIYATDTQGLVLQADQSAVDEIHLIDETFVSAKLTTASLQVDGLSNQDGPATFGGVINATSRILQGSVTDDGVTGGQFESISTTTGATFGGDVLIESPSSHGYHLKGDSYQNILGFRADSTRRFVMESGPFGSGSNIKLAVYDNVGANAINIFSYQHGAKLEIVPDIDLTGRILQGSVTDDGVTGGQFESISTTTGATFGDTLKVQTNDTNQYALELEQNPLASAIHLSSKGDGYMGWVGFRDNGTRRFALESTPSNNGSNLTLQLRDSLGANAQTVFSASYGFGFDVFYDTKVPRILQGSVTDDGTTGGIFESLKSEGGVALEALPSGLPAGKTKAGSLSITTEGEVYIE
jgi:hypothetical protein